MTTANITFTETLSVWPCAECGILFGIPLNFEERRRKDHRCFYCPSGHVNVWGGKTNLEKRAERLETQLVAERRNAEKAEERWRREQREHAATKGQLTKTKKRVAAGV